MSPSSRFAKDKLVIFDPAAIQPDCEDSLAPLHKSKVIQDNECIVLQWLSCFHYQMQEIFVFF